jgi:hypothetical protein
MSEPASRADTALNDFRREGAEEKFCCSTISSRHASQTSIQSFPTLDFEVAAVPHNPQSGESCDEAKDALLDKN